MTTQTAFAFMAHPCGLERTFCDDCDTELEVGQTGQCSDCQPKTRTFDELSDIEKDAARAAYSGEGYLGHDWWDYDDFVTVGKLLGVEIDMRDVKLMSGKTRQEPNISFSGFCSQDDGACFEGSYSCAPNAIKDIANYAPQDTVLAGIAERLNAVQVLARLKWGETLSASVTTSGRYSHSGTMNVTVNDLDDSVVDPTAAGEDAFIDMEETITRCMRDFADWIYGQLENQYDWLMSDECVDQYLIEEKFDEDGKVI